MFNLFIYLFDHYLQNHFSKLISLSITMSFSSSSSSSSSHFVSEHKICVCSSRQQFLKTIPSFFGGCVKAPIKNLIQFYEFIKANKEYIWEGSALYRSIHAKICDLVVNASITQDHTTMTKLQQLHQDIFFNSSTSEGETQKTISKDQTILDTQPIGECQTSSSTEDELENDINNNEQEEGSISK